MQGIRLAHSLKSAAGNIDAVTLQNLARESEVLLRVGSDEKVSKDLVAALREMLATVDYALSLQPSTEG